MKILVTGGLGFIGTRLVRKLTEKGHDVVSVDLHVRDFEDYVRADVTSFSELWRVFKLNGPFDMVIHTAGEVGRMIGEEHPQKMVYVNDVGVINLIQLCLEYDTRLVYFSTSEVYGKKFDELECVKEEDLMKTSPFDVTNIYAMSKLFGEALVAHYTKNYGLKAVSIRPFMIYGPGVYPSKYKSALDQFVYNALLGKPLIVHKGSERAWCYVDDFVEGVILVAEKHSFESKKYEAYNIGSEEYISTEDLARKCVKIVGASEKLIELVDPPNKFLSARKRFSVDKIKKLGYAPKVSLDRGIEEVVKWYRNLLGNLKSH
ncbi:NAD-dependent epimerase/dehydratase family protein [Pseudothermotoga sp.]